MRNNLLIALAVLLLSHLYTLAQPNVVIFYADDLGWGDLSVNNSDPSYFRHTPNIDSIFNQGIRLDNFITHCVCSPSRAGLLTGKHYAEIASGPYVNGELPNDANTWNFARDFKSQGYKTGLIGKWHNGNVPVPASGHGQLVNDFDSEMIPLNDIFEYEAGFHFGPGVESYGFDKFIGYYDGWCDLFNRQGTPYKGRQLAWWHGNAPNTEPGYTTDLITQYANQFIDDNQSSPFCLYIPHQAVHDPLHVKLSDLQELCAVFPGEWDFVKNIASPTTGRLINNVAELRCGKGEEFDFSVIDGGNGHYTNLLFATFLYSLDKSVGAVMQKVTDIGEYNNTIFVFSSDNGGLAHGSSLPFQGGKSTLWEGGVHVPTAVMWPGTFDANTAPYSPGNNSFNGHIGYLDFYPTIMDMAGLNCAGLELDGKNCWPFLQSNTESRNGYEDPYFEMWRDHGTVRTTDWKLFYSESLNRVELYDIKNDISESNNLAAGRPNIRDNLIGLYKDWISSKNYAVPYVSLESTNILYPDPAPSGEYLEVKATQNATNNNWAYVHFATGDWVKDKPGFYTEPGDRIEYDIYICPDSDKTSGFFYTPGYAESPLFNSSNGVNQDGEMLHSMTMPKGVWLRQVVGIGVNSPRITDFNYIALTGIGTGYYHFYLDNIVVRTRDGHIRTVIWRSSEDSDTFLYRFKHNNYSTIAEVKAINGFAFSNIEVNVVPVISPGANMLQNPSFENGGSSPENWTLSGTGLASASIDTSSNGNRSLKLSTTAAAQVTPSTQLVANVLPGTNYRVSMWVQNAGQTAGRFILDMNDKPTPTEDMQFLLNPGDAPLWKKYSGVWNSGTQQQVTIRLFTNALFEGTIYIDELEFAHMPDDEYAHWKSDRGLFDDDADPDIDGLSNFMEFALGGNPLSVDSDLKPKVVRVSGGYEYKFQRKRDSAAYTVQTSEDLLSWDDYVTASDIHGPVGGESVVSILDNVMSDDKLFIRLKTEL